MTVAFWGKRAPQFEHGYLFSDSNRNRKDIHKISNFGSNNSVHREISMDTIAFSLL